MLQNIKIHSQQALAITAPSTEENHGSVSKSRVFTASTDKDSARIANRSESSYDMAGLSASQITTKTNINQVYIKDLVVILLTLREQLALTELSAKKAKTISDKLGNIAQILQGNDTNAGKLSAKEIALISLNFEDLSHSIPVKKSTANIKELTQLLANNLASTWLQKEKAIQIKEWVQTQSPSFKPGAASVKSLSVGVNAGANLLQLPSVSGNVGPYVNAGVTGTIGRAMTADDDGGMFADKFAKVSGKISAGAEIGVGNHLGLKAGGEVQYSRTRAATKFYDGPQSYAEAEMHHTSKVSRNSYLNLKPNKITKAIKSLFPSQSEMQQIDKIQQLAVNGQQRLTQLLSGLGVSNTLKAVAPQYARANVDHYSLTSRQAKAEAVAKVGLSKIKMAAAEASVTLSQTYGDIGIHVPKNFSQAIKENRLRLLELPSNYYQHASELIAHTPQAQLAATSITAMGLLEADVKAYYSAVKEYDYQKSLGLNANKALQKTMAQQKHVIEQRWGAIGRHQFIQFAAASHAVLADKITQHKDQLTTIEVKRSQGLISALGTRIYQPEIQHSPRRLDKLVNFNKEFMIKLNDTTASFNISAGPLSGTLAITHKDRTHPSIVREGKYIDISFTLAASAGVSTVNFVKDLNKKLKHKIDSTLKEQGIDNINEYSFLPGTSNALAGTYMIRLFKPTHDQYQVEQQYRKLFSRQLATVSTDTDLSGNVTVTPGISVGASLAVNKSATRVAGETLGTKDLTYPSMMYKSFFERNDHDPKNQEWQDFTKQHKNELKQLFQNLAKPKERVHKDALALLKQGIERAELTADKQAILSAKRFKDEFIESMQHLKQSPKDDYYYNQALKHFNTLLKYQIPAIDQAFAGRLKNKATELNADSGLSSGSILFNRISSRRKQRPETIAPKPKLQTVNDQIKPLTPSAPTLDDINDEAQPLTPTVPALADINRPY